MKRSAPSRISAARTGLGSRTPLHPATEALRLGAARPWHLRHPASVSLPQHWLPGRPLLGKGNKDNSVTNGSASRQDAKPRSIIRSPSLTGAFQGASAEGATLRQDAASARNEREGFLNQSSHPVRDSLRVFQRQQMAGIGKRRQRRAGNALNDLAGQHFRRQDSVAGAGQNMS